MTRRNEATNTCEERIDQHLESRLQELEMVFNQHDHVEYCEDYNSCNVCGEVGVFSEYGLSFDYVEANTFNDQPEGYYRYQISWGGPQDEFRIFPKVNGLTMKIDRVEYWFLDWYDGAYRDVTDNDLINDIIEFFREIGSIKNEDITIY